jgi:hypothetical protein
MRNFKALSLALDHRLRPFLDAPITSPRRGWGRSIREAIGMTGRRTLDAMIRDRAEELVREACQGQLARSVVEILATAGRRDLWR